MSIDNNILGLEAGFLAAMQDADIEPTDDIIADGELHRVYSEGDSPGSKDAWYVLHGDTEVPYGFFGHWREGETHTWTLKDPKTLTEDEKKDLEQKREAHRLKREAELEIARKRCRRIAAKLWEQSKPCTEHPYLTRKGIQAHGIRAFTSGMLVIPLRSHEHQITGLQFIDAEGQKRFLPGTEKSGAFFMISGTPNNKVAICEGFATGASIHEATGLTVAIAFDAGNLEKVSSALRKSLPEAEIIICADNDHSKSTNTGLIKGNNAASLVGARLTYPTFPEGVHGTDFNDLHMVAGLDAVRTAIESADAVTQPNTLELPAPITENCTEVTNSVYLTHAIVDKAVFVPEDCQWAACKSDGFWEFGSSHVVEEAAKSIRNIWLAAAKGESDEKTANTLMAFSKKTASAAGITAMLKLASSQPSVRISRSQFDSNPLVIGVQNGVVNLETLSFRQARPSDYVSKRLNSHYIHGATCPRWRAFLSESVGADSSADREAMVIFLQVMTAAALLGVRGLRSIFHIYGPPGSGKSLFVNVLQALFGEYGKSLSPNAISNPRFRDSDVKMPEIAGLNGTRLATIYEAGEGICFNDELLKALSGGDLITARVLHKNPFEFVFGGILLSVGNGLPASSTGASPAFMERLKLIPFPNAVPIERRNLRLEQELRDELPGILNWALAGVEIYREQGMKVPASVAATVASYREALDTVQSFITEECDEGESYWESAASLHQAYAQWAKDNGLPALGYRVFASRLVEKGFAKQRQRSIRGHGGIRIKVSITDNRGVFSIWSRP